MPKRHTGSKHQPAAGEAARVRGANQAQRAASRLRLAAVRSALADERRHADQTRRKRNGAAWYDHSKINT